MANELPPGWTLDEIARGTPPLYGFDLTGVSVLAWEIHDDGAFCYESCLVLRVLPKDYGHGRWCLTHLYRHPRLPNPQWRISSVHVSGADEREPLAGEWIDHLVYFRGPVGNAELYAALDRVNWSFGGGDEGACPLVGRRVCQRSWEAAIGEKPTRVYGR